MQRLIAPGSYAPMPALRKGDVTRVLPGGLPPVPYRTQNNWLKANRYAHSDGTSKACRAECKLSHLGWV